MKFIFRWVNEWGEFDMQLLRLSVRGNWYVKGVNIDLVILGLGFWFTIKKTPVIP